MSEHPQKSQRETAGSGAVHAREIGRFSARRHDSTKQRTALVVIGGLHGNEPAGIHAAQRVLEVLESEQPTGFDGSLIALRGNLAAINHHNVDLRYVVHDINRMFTDEQIGMPADTSPEHEQMQELLASLREIRAQSDRMILVDLHSTSADMHPVVVLEDSIAARSIARKMPLPIYLGFEEELPGLLIDRVTNELGVVAMVVEGGQHRSPKSVDVLEAVIWSLLDATGVLPLHALPHERDPRRVLYQAAGDERWSIFDVRYRRPIAHPDFEMRDGVGNGRKIKPGVTIIAVENGSAVTSPVRGRVFMPNMQAHKRPGDDGFFIVRRVGEGWLGLSARLRKQQWMHRFISHMPGVHRLDERTLLVDADLAAVLRRQVFHLLGYRLIRHDSRKSGRGIGRVYKGFAAFFRAMLRKSPENAPNVDDTRFWVVRRHKLDA